MTLLIRTLAGLAALAIAALPAAAQTPGNPARSLAPALLERALQINDYVELRTSAELIAIERPVSNLNAAPLSAEESREVKFGNLGTFVDVRPFRNNFVISGGLYTGDTSRNDAPASVASPALVAASLDSEASGRLQMAVKGDSFAPFLGLGYESTAPEGRGWGMKLMAGAILSGTPDVALTSRGGSLSGETVMRQQLQREHLLYEEQFETSEVHPVLQVGLSYRF